MRSIYRRLRLDAPPLTLETQMPGWGTDHMGHAQTSVIRMEMHHPASGPGSPRERKLRLGGRTQQSPTPAALPSLSLSLSLFKVSSKDQVFPTIPIKLPGTKKDNHFHGLMLLRGNGLKAASSVPRTLPSSSMSFGDFQARNFATTGLIMGYQ